MRKLDVIGLHCHFLEDYGFTFHPSNMLFYKEHPQGQEVVFIHFAEYPDGNILEYNLGVRIHQVEELIHKFLPTLSNYSEKSITLLQSPEKIGKIIPGRFNLVNDSQLADAIQAAERFFVTDGFNWMQKMVDPENLERAFAERKEKSFRSQNFVYTAFRGVALAKLYNPKDYPVLRNIYLEHIQNRLMTPFTIASFLQFLNFLDNLNPDSSS